MGEDRRGEALRATLLLLLQLTSLLWLSVGDDRLVAG